MSGLAIWTTSIYQIWAGSKQKEYQVTFTRPGARISLKQANLSGAHPPHHRLTPQPSCPHASTAGRCKQQWLLCLALRQHKMLMTV